MTHVAPTAGPQPPADPKRRGKPMTGWYDPGQLIQTGIRVTASTVFGRMFDRRELMAALDAFDPADFAKHHDYSKTLTAEAPEFYLDYCADTGDGWTSTHAVARLLARPLLRIDPPTGGTEEPATLPRGRALVIGGDLVYPTASREEYSDRLQVPFDAANQTETGHATLKNAEVFAIPGNHDWYDGLTAFSHLFCRRHMAKAGSAESPVTTVLGRKTHQGRSYFALKLPQDWWLLAYDIQFDGFVDQAQLSFFEHIAQAEMAEGSNVILCVGQPVWAYAQNSVPEAFRNAAFAAQVVTGALDRADGQPTRKHNLRLVLTGDAHHYAHFTETDGKTDAVVHYLTCGLGGAFLHPTHWLRTTQADVRWAAPLPLKQDPAGTLPNGRKWYRRTFTLGKVYPEAEVSRSMTLWNLAFAWINPWFGAFMGGVGIFAAWLLHFAALVNGSTLTELLGRGSACAAVRTFITLLLDSPWPLLVIGGIIAALVYFNDHANRWMRRLIGISHALAHVLAYCALLIVLARLLPASRWGDVWLVISMGAATFVTASTIMGIYLLVGLNVFNGHWNEAFSSLRVEKYKGFLRLKIDRAGTLTVYPIVTDEVEETKLAPRLVEEPIVLKKQARGPVTAHTKL